LIVQDVDLDGNILEKYSVAVDAVGAGVGELVLTASGSSARMTDATKDKPVDSVIMAIVDTLEVHGKILYQK
jgi:microcompartment protein CcmK/EutM